MSEFKVDQSITSEIASLQYAGDNLLGEIKSFPAGKISGMKTAKEYERQRKDIIKLLKAYRNLITQDTKALNDIVEATNQLDNQMSKSF